MGADWGAFTQTETKMTVRPQSHNDLVYPQQPQTHASALLSHLTGDFTTVVPEAPGLLGQQGHSCNGGHELRILAAASADPWMPLALPGLGTLIPHSCLPACVSTGPLPGLPHLCLHPSGTQQCPANSHPFQDQRENKETSPQLGLTRNGQHGWGLFRPLIDPAAVLNPEDADGLGWAHGLAGEVEGGVFGDVQALGLHSEVRKSYRERVKERSFQTQNPES